MSVTETPLPMTVRADHVPGPPQGCWTYDDYAAIPDDGCRYEIASPGTAGYDRRTKQDAYARAGIREYWLVDLFARAVELLVPDGDAYRSAGAFSGSQTLPSVVLPGFPVPVEQLLG